MDRVEIGDLRVDDVYVRFGGVQAVAGMSLRIDRGERVGLVGANGAGKSTLVAVISGNVRCQRGAVTYGGRDLLALRPFQRARVGVGLSFQHPAIFGNLTVRENVLIGARNSAERAVEWMNAAGLSDWAEVNLRDTPYGIRKRTDLARALAGDVGLLVADEPAAGLSEEERKEIADMLVRTCERRGSSLLLIEHDFSLIRRCCDRIYVMDDGASIFEGSPADALHDARVIGAYLGDAASQDR